MRNYIIPLVVMVSFMAIGAVSGVKILFPLGFVLAYVTLFLLTRQSK